MVCIVKFVNLFDVDSLAQIKLVEFEWQWCLFYNRSSASMS